MSTEQLAAIDRSIQRAKSTASFGDAITRLRASREYREVIEEGYFAKEAVRLVHLKADPAMQTPDAQKSIIQQIDAIGAFAQFLTVQLQMAAIARKEITAGEEAREEILSEEANNG
jgi:hypothetical protein